MEEDIKTQEHAFILARVYNLAPFDNLKTERATTRGSALQSCWLATKNRDARCFVQYHQDELFPYELNITGVLDPDMTGDYIAAGAFGEKMYYEKDDSEYFIWWNEDDTSWYISPILGTTGTLGHFTKANDPVNGIYTAVAPATGIPTIKEK